MSFPSSADIAILRRASTSVMPDSATIDQTGVTAKCSVNKGTGQARLAGLPTFLRVPEWLVEMEDGTELKPGYTFTVTSWGGQYIVLEALNPHSYAYNSAAKCVLTRDGSGMLAMLTNTTVTFRNPRGIGSGAAPLTAAVFISETSLDLEQFPEASGYKYAVLFDPKLGVIGGDPKTGVRGGWEMTWTDILGEAHTEILSDPTRLTDFLPIVLSHVKTQ